MPEKYIKADYQDGILPGRLYRFETALEIPLSNFPNLDKMLAYFVDRVRVRVDVESLSITKGLVGEEKAELFVFISFGQSEATKSVWENWKILEWQLSAIGKPKLINVDIETPELPVQLAQPEITIIAQVKQWIADWHGLIELILLIVIILILLEKKQ